mgnify:CR=1 FL=1
MIVMIPEKLHRNKVLIELEPAPHGATDLSGDVGAVGRLLVPKADAAAPGERARVRQAWLARASARCGVRVGEAGDRLLRERRVA